MAKKKKIAVGWAMMRLNKAGNWVPVEPPEKKYEVIDDHQNYSLWPDSVGDYYKGRRAGTLKVKKMYVTM